MGWKQLIASLVEHLAWPAVVVIMYFLTRDHLATLFSKVARFKFKDFEFDFDRIKKETEAVANATTENPSKPGEPVKPTAPVFNSMEEQIFELVEKSPSGAIILAWSAVETALADASARINMPDSIRTTSKIIRNLESEGHLSRRQTSLVTDMRDLRNKVMHRNGNGSISRDQAYAFAMSATTVVNLLNGVEISRKVFMTPTGSWVQLPPNFSEFSSNERGGVWNYSEVRLPNGLTAGVGPWKTGVSGSSGYSHYSIDIEQPQNGGSETLASLLIDLSLISEGALSKSASSLVRFDQNTNEVTFDLGKSVFKYKFD